MTEFLDVQSRHVWRATSYSASLNACLMPFEVVLSRGVTDIPWWPALCSSAVGAAISFDAQSFTVKDEAALKSPMTDKLVRLAVFGDEAEKEWARWVIWEAARAVGVNTTSVKLAAFALSAALTSLVGTFHGIYLNFIDPETMFSLPTAIQVAMFALIGGLGTVTGPI